MAPYFLSMLLIIRATNLVKTKALKQQDVTTLVFGKNRKTFVAGYGTHVIRVADPSLGIMFTNSLQVYKSVLLSLLSSHLYPKFYLLTNYNLHLILIKHRLEVGEREEKM